MNSLKPVPPVQKTNRTILVSKDFQSCDFVFVRDDSVRKPLQPPYKGPFRVLKRSDKLFTLDINGQEKVISIDRLKPAFILNTEIEEDPRLLIIPKQLSRRRSQIPIPKTRVTFR